MGQHTPLFERHVELGARIVDFGGWDMPLHYGSQVEEHHAVRRDAGVFDVSHMNVVDVFGPDARPFLRRVLANDVARLDEEGQALYGCMLADDGGIIDDLITYFIGADRYRVILNAATRDKDLDWLAARAEGRQVTVAPNDDAGMLAVQGPRAREIAGRVLPATLRDAALALPPFSSLTADDWFIARTGYTGEDGFEIVVPSGRIGALYAALVDAGARPAGLGARDTLRLEAGLHLYGSDMDESVSPLESGLGWTCAFEPEDRDFLGRAALDAQRGRDDLRRFKGLLLEAPGVLRDRQRVIVDGKPDGVVTSGGYAPTLERSIGMARLPAGDEPRVQVEVRNRLLDARVVPLPFVRHGKAKIDL